MSRLPELRPDEMTPEQKRVYDTIMAGPRGYVAGPLAMWLHRPAFADRAQQLGEYCRYGTSLAKPVVEIAILVTARQWRAEYEWLSHRGKAREVGVADAIVEAIRTGQTPAFDRDDERIAHDIAVALHRDRRLPDALFARGRELLGEAGLVDLIGVIGYYTLIAMTITAFDVQPPEGTALAFAEDAATG